MALIKRHFDASSTMQIFKFILFLKVLFFLLRIHLAWILFLIVLALIDFKKKIDDINVSTYFHKIKYRCQLSMQKRRRNYQINSSTLKECVISFYIECLFDSILLYFSTSQILILIPHFINSQSLLTF